MTGQRQLRALLDARERLLLDHQEAGDARGLYDRERQEVLVRLYRTHQEDRLRLARDLHDHAGQHLVSLKLGLKRLSPHVAENGRETIDALLRQIDQADRELRRVMLQLRPEALDEFGLSAALCALVENWNDVNGSIGAFDLVGAEADLSSEAEITLYRLTQEALTNISKHAAGVTAARVTLHYTDQAVTLAVEDDGCGFDAATIRSGSSFSEKRFGLIGMRERLTLVRGALSVDSAPGLGTTITARLPVGRETHVT